MVTIFFLFKLPASPIAAYICWKRVEVRGKEVVKHVIYAYTDIPTYIYGGINIKKPNYLKNKSLQIPVLVL